MSVVQLVLSQLIVRTLFSPGADKLNAMIPAIENSNATLSGLTNLVTTVHLLATTSMRRTTADSLERTSTKTSAFMRVVARITLAGSNTVT